MTVQAPRFFVQVDGEDLPDDVRQAVQSITIEEHSVGRPAPASEIALTIANPGYAFSDRVVLQPGREIDVYVSLAGDEAQAEHLAHGIVVKAPVQFSQTGMPSIRVIARDDSDGARVGDVRKGWPKQADSRRVHSIAQAHSWSTSWRGRSSVASTQTARHTSQQAPDMAFLASLAKRYAYDVAVRWDQSARRWSLLWGPPIEDGSLSLDLRHNFPGWPVVDQVLAFSPMMASAGHMVTGLEVVGFSSVTAKKTVQKRVYKAEPFSTVSEDAVEGVAVGANIRATVFGESVKITSGKVIGSQKEAERFARAWLQRHADGFIQGPGRMAGRPDVRAGQTHEFSFYSSEPGGARKIGRYSGRYYLMRVRHTLAPGQPYMIDFAARLRSDR